MPLIDDIGNLFRRMSYYMLGKGALTIAVMAAGLMGGMMPALVVAVGGTLLTAFNRLMAQGTYEQQMVELYRDEIAIDLGIAPPQVTRAHLQEAAKHNDVIDQALRRQRNKTILAISTAALSGAISFGLLSFFGAEKTLETVLGNWVSHTFGSAMAGSVVNIVGVGTVAGLTSLVVHDGLEVAIGHGAGIAKAAAHDRILDLSQQLARGQAVNKEQVYGVFVAGEPSLQHAILKQFRKPYERLSPRDQSVVLAQIGVAEPMQELARQLNAGMKPGQLAYMMGDAMRHQQMRLAVAHAEDPSHVRSHFVERLGHSAGRSEGFRAQLAAEPAPSGERKFR